MKLKVEKTFQSRGCLIGRSFEIYCSTGVKVL